MKLIGIDIGHWSLKTVEVLSGPKSNSIEKIHEIQLKGQTPDDVRIEIIDFLRTQYADKDLQNTKISVAIHQDSVLLRKLDFPFRERFKIKKSLPFEMEDLIPFNSEDCVFDFKITEYQGALSRCLGVACPRELIIETIQMFNEARVPVHLITPKGFALNNIFEDIEQIPKDVPVPPKETDDIEENPNTTIIPKWIDPALRKASALLDIGHKNTLLLVRSEDKLIGLRSINWGGADIINQISQDLKLQPHEAFQLLKTNGQLLIKKDDPAVPDSQRELVKSIRRSIDVFGKELNFTVLNLISGSPLQIQNIAMIGGVSQLPMLGPVLTQHVEIPCNLLVKIKRYPALNLKDSPNNERSLGTAIGLTLALQRKSKSPAINFRSGEFAYNSQSFKVFWNKWGKLIQYSGAFYILCFVFSILFSSWSGQLKDKTEQRLKEVAANTFSLPKAKISQSLVKKEIKNGTKILTGLKNAEKLSNIPLSLDFLKKTLPQNFDGQIVYYQVSGKRGELKLSTSSPQILDLLKTKLQSLSKPKSVQSTRINNDPMAPNATLHQITWTLKE